MRRFSTDKHKKYWQSRKIDWRSAYFDTWNHPHRFMLVEKLKRMKWDRLFEVGCASGPNLYLLYQHFPEKHFAGVDVNEEAIKTAKQLLQPKIYVGVQEAGDLYLGDNGTDVILTDMTLIYIDPSKIHQTIKEIYRAAKKYILFCEFHSNSFFKRWGLRLATGYNAYDYERLLEKHGFREIEIEKIPEEKWPGGEPQKTFGYIISAIKI
ncbi:MAG: class I SAM-dependent methyltransferase [Nanoarchaeota archaeon]